MIITETVVKRGYWDGRFDELACYDTNDQAKMRTQENSRIINLFTDSTSDSNSGVTVEEFSFNSSVIASNPCAGKDRGTGYWAALYIDPLGDVCKDMGTVYPNGKSVKSVWLVDEGTEPQRCPQIYIKENYYPPKYTYVDYSSAFLNFLYVDWYQWSPKYCP